MMEGNWLVTCRDPAILQGTSSGLYASSRGTLVLIGYVHMFCCNTCSDAAPRDPHLAVSRPKVTNVSVANDTMQQRFVQAAQTGYQGVPKHSKSGQTVVG